MPQAYIGLVRWAEGVPTAADRERQRTGGQWALTDLLEKVRTLPDNIPASARLIASYRVASRDLHAVVVVEAEGLQDLMAIEGHYSGWFEIEWHPTMLVERS